MKAQCMTALIFGGDGPPPTTAITEEWNGSSWTEVGNINNAVGLSKSDKR